MKKFHFTLDRMLSYKETMLDREKDVLHALHAERSAVERRIADNEAFLVQTSAELKESTTRGLAAMHLQLFRFKLENTRDMLVQLAKELREINARVDEQTQVVLLASQEVSGLQKLEEKQRKEYDYEVQKQEAEIISELVASKYAAAQKE